MKIKQVCEQTGLTDRAIRFYIEEGLAAPAYTENYLGRRSYDFSDEDVTALNHVATLRKFGFTVEEIRTILANPQESIAIVAAVRTRKEETIRQEGENLAALARLDGEKAYTVAELAEALVEPVKTAEIPKEDRWGKWKDRLKAFLKALPIWLVLLGPALLLASIMITQPLNFRFLHIRVYWRGILLGLLPTIVLGMLIILRRFVKVRYGMLLITALLGVLYYLPWGMLFSAFSMDAYSETDDIAYYRQVDDLFYWAEATEALFPEQAGEDGRYYYCCGYDSCQSLYAEWALPQDELEGEVARVTELLSGKKGYQEFQRGSYTCLAINGGWYAADTPFLLENSPHTVTFFAYNPQTGVVRYIFCDERCEPDDPPYYMTLEW